MVRGGVIKLPAWEVFHWEQRDMLHSEEPFHTSAQQICLLGFKQLNLATNHPQISNGGSVYALHQSERWNLRKVEVVAALTQF